MKHILEKYSITNESSLSRVWQHGQNHDIGFITAFRYATDCGEGDVYSTSENKKRNSKLKAMLLKKGYGVTKVDGTYIENYGSENQREVKEDTFMVVDLKDTGNLKKDLIKFGQEFEQDSILFQPKGAKVSYLISSNTCKEAYPGFGKVGVEIKLGKPVFGDSGEFHTKIKGRPFVFKEIKENLVTIDKLSIAEIRSITALAESEI